MPNAGEQAAIIGIAEAQIRAIVHQLEAGLGQQVEHIAVLRLPSRPCLPQIMLELKPPVDPARAAQCFNGAQGL